MVWPNMSLRGKILTIVAALTFLCIGGGLVSLWFTYQMNSFLRSIVDEDLAAFEAAEELNTALVMQKGYLTYYFQDSNPAWLDELKKREDDFKTWLARARSLTNSTSEREILDQIDSEYITLVFLRNQVIDYYQKGRRENGYDFHQQARRDFFKIRELTKGYKEAYRKRINDARGAILKQANQFIKLSVLGIACALFLGALLAFVLVRQVLEPIRRLATKADAAHVEAVPIDEVQALRDGLDRLIEDVDETKSQLELSREHLIQASKLASVGKLAAGVAHSIRNPLTSVKMRLFSLERSLELSSLQEEDFAVISEEIHHIDNIVRNFLEFSRRPKLNVQWISPSDVVDMTLNLLHHRLESFGVEVEVHRASRLPQIRADSEQLREVLVNLIINACEALSADQDRATPGSAEGLKKIRVIEEVASISPWGEAVVIRVSDEGPGVPPEVEDRIFYPFFTTKDEGTGLGLSIALRIVEEHGGRLELESNLSPGATFTITLPASGSTAAARVGDEEERLWAKS